MNFDLKNYVTQRCREATWKQVEYMLRHYIDNPIEGEITADTLKAAGVISIFFDKDSPRVSVDYPVHEDENGNISLKIDTGLIGIAQGYMLIKPDGTRRPLSYSELDYLSKQVL